MVNELVKRLSDGKHEVVIGHRDEPYEREFRIRNNRKG